MLSGMESIMVHSTEHLEDDLGIAAFLVVKGFKLLGLASGERGHYSFRFDDSAGDAKETAMSYLRGDLVAARDLISAEKNLKTFLYSAKSTRNGNRNEDAPKDSSRQRTA
jgi:hypothetical protein